MRGLELARAFWKEHDQELFERLPDGLHMRASAGLAGEGSECLGFDDETSRDHDWGAGFCIWLSDEDFERWGDELARRYDVIATGSFRGYPVRTARTSQGVQRVGVFRAGDFYLQLLGIERAPMNLAEWEQLPETTLAAATNGELFCAGASGFAETRETLLAYYPEDLRCMRMASECLVMAQAGQYNFPRSVNRGEALAALQALDRFVEAAIALCYALNRHYRPYYKWAAHGLARLPRCGEELGMLLRRAVGSFQDRVYSNCADMLERACTLLATELRRQGLSDSEETFFVAQAAQVHSRIKDRGLRRAPIEPRIPA